MKNFKLPKYEFAKGFTVMAWITLLAYVAWCTFAGIKTDSVRDAWNILILIAGYVWGKTDHGRNKPNPDPNSLQQ